jgi:hypothetical protein
LIWRICLLLSTSRLNPAKFMVLTGKCMSVRPGRASGRGHEVCQQSLLVLVEFVQGRGTRIRYPEKTTVRRLTCCSTVARTSGAVARAMDVHLFGMAYPASYAFAHCSTLWGKAWVLAPLQISFLAPSTPSEHSAYQKNVSSV